MIRAGALSEMLNFVQTSDVHFRGNDKGTPHDLDYELRNELIRDVRAESEYVGGISAVLVCGDVAYSGRESEYSQASSWLRDLCAAADVDQSLVWVVPGNHDVQHEQIRGQPRQAFLRGQLRTTNADQLDGQLRSILQDTNDGPTLLLPLTNYVAFAGQFECEIDTTSPFWIRRLPVREGWELELHGITSPLISDYNDDQQANRLVIGEMQAMVLRKDCTVHLTMCHHPRNWLHDGEEISKRLDTLAQIQITGHMHTHALSKTTAGVHLAAGALHPERPHRSCFEPRYNIVSVDVTSDDPPSVEIRIYPRVWHVDSRRFVGDPAYAKGVATYRLDLDTGHTPGRPVEVPPGATAGQLSDARRRVRYRLFLLAPSDRYTVALALGAPAGQLLNAGIAGLPVKLIGWATDNERLRDLWDAVETQHGNQQGESNPF